MAIKTVINSSKGFFAETGSTDGNQGFLPFKLPVQTLTASSTTFTAGDAGVTYLSRSGGAATVILPAASTCPGAEFVFRTVTAQAHVVSASANTITYGEGVGGLNANYSQLTFAASANRSAILKSDGASYVILGGASSSFTGS